MHLACLQIHMGQTLLWVKENLYMTIAGTHTCLLQVHLHDMIYYSNYDIVFESRNYYITCWIFQIQIYVYSQHLHGTILFIFGMLILDRCCHLVVIDLYMFVWVLTWNLFAWSVYMLRTVC